MSYSIQELSEFLTSSTFSNFIGLKIHSFTEGKLLASFQLNPMIARIDGVAHGGMLSYFADSIMGFASLSLIENTQTVFTIDLKVSYLRQAKAKTIYCEAYVLKAGKRVHFCEADMYILNEKQEKILVAKSSASMSVNEKSE